MTYESSNLLILSVFIYISTSLAFSRSHPFRTRIYRNPLFLLSLLLLTGINLLILLLAPPALLSFLMLRDLPDPVFKLQLLLFALLHLLASVGFELLVVERPALWRSLRRAVARTSASSGARHLAVRRRIATSDDSNPVRLIGKEIRPRSVAVGKESEFFFSHKL